MLSRLNGMLSVHNISPELCSGNGCLSSMVTNIIDLIRAFQPFILMLVLLPPVIREDIADRIAAVIPHYHNSHLTFHLSKWLISVVTG